MELKMASKNQKKPKTKQIPKNLAWGGVNKFLSTIGRGLDPGSADCQFTTACYKVKEFSVLLHELKRSAKQLKKGVQVKISAIEGFIDSLSHIVSIENENEFFIRPITQMKETEVVGMVTYIDFLNKIDLRLVSPIEAFISHYLDNATEAKRAWKKARVEYDIMSNRLDQTEQQPEPEPIKLFVTQSQYHMARIREQEKYENASDLVSEVLWMREYQILKYQVDFMMEFHDLIADHYSLVWELCLKSEKIYELIKAKKEQFQIKKENREEKRRKEEKEARESKYQPLIEILSSKDFVYLDVIINSSDKNQEQLISKIVKIFDAYGIILPCIKAYIIEEVSNTKNEATLFRGNSIATKLMTAYTKLIGSKYIMIINKLISEVMEEPQVIEVDPSKEKNNEILAQNLTKLNLYCQKFVDVIIGSTEECPIEIREITKYLANAVNGKFDQASTLVSAGFIFLRFFCPAISSPGNYGMASQDIPTPSRRSLILITKVIQNLANGLKFGNKEAFLLDINNFIERNLQPVEEFLAKLRSVPDFEFSPSCSISSISGDLLFVHETIVNNLERIAQGLASSKNEYLIDPFVENLGLLGDLPGIPEKAPTTKTKVLADIQKKLS